MFLSPELKDVFHILMSAYILIMLIVRVHFIKTSGIRTQNYDIHSSSVHRLFEKLIG